MCFKFLNQFKLVSFVLNSQYTIVDCSDILLLYHVIGSLSFNFTSALYDELFKAFCLAKII